MSEVVADPEAGGDADAETDRDMDEGETEFVVDVPRDGPGPPLDERPIEDSMGFEKE